MSFEGIGKSIQTNRAPTHIVDTPPVGLNEFSVGYSLAGCSPALPASASPTANQYAFSNAQIRVIYTQQCVTYVSEHVLPMSSGHTGKEG